MKLKLNLLAGTALLAGSLTLLGAAAPPAQPVPASLGEEQNAARPKGIAVVNYQGQELGRIVDLGIDLTNGRIAMVHVVPRGFFGLRGKAVAVPPLALSQLPGEDFYRLDASAATFRSAPKIDFATWSDTGRGQRVAAAYRLFGQEPYFLEEGAAAGEPSNQPKVPLGYLARSSMIVGLPIQNHQGEHLGQVEFVSYDIPQGRILTVNMVAMDKFGTKSRLAPQDLSFTPARNAFLLNLLADTEQEYANKSLAGEILAANFSPGNVAVATVNGRFVLSGWVLTNAEKQRAGAIAAAASRPELVDNQIRVGAPVTSD